LLKKLCQKRKKPKNKGAGGTDHGGRRMKDGWSIVNDQIAENNNVANGQRTGQQQQKHQ